MVTPAVFEEQWFPLNDAGTLAITHVEHAYESADVNWQVSAYADQAFAVQEWASRNLDIDIAFWLSGLIAYVALALVGILLIGAVLRIKPWVLAFTPGLLWGGAIGNQVELGLFDDVTDWRWVAGDWGELILGPFGLGSAGVMNLADGAIFLAFWIFWLAAAWRLLVFGAGVLRWFFGVRSS